ncbi:hypothetical protein FACHB389_01595 [Nostoc calcicola FACHB-389]|nr:DUF3237 domain-containing protein [Nostoc calcicola FACHB-3891]OKH42374.1 hypothetical protein FACHB389_01595 [Nostoc calcicola FACHB-389]
MKLEPLLTLRVDITAPLEVGTGPYGTRLIFNIGGGTFEGGRLRGKILPGGADWILVDGEGVWHMDVRLLLETEDGARIYVQYYGVMVMNEKIGTALASGGATEYGDTYFMTQLRFETGDGRYRWLNRVVAVGEGRLESGVVEYRVCELVNDSN